MKQFLSAALFIASIPASSYASDVSTCRVFVRNNKGAAQVTVVGDALNMLVTAPENGFDFKLTKSASYADTLGIVNLLYVKSSNLMKYEIRSLKPEMTLAGVAGLTIRNPGALKPEAVLKVELATPGGKFLEFQLTQSA